MNINEQIKELENKQWQLALYQRRLEAEQITLTNAIDELHKKKNTKSQLFWPDLPEGAFFKFANYVDCGYIWFVLNGTRYCLGDSMVTEAFRSDKTKTEPVIRVNREGTLYEEEKFTSFENQ